MSFYHKIKQAFQQKRQIDTHAYYPQFRIEARARDADNDDSLSMRTADALWMLGRQWQFGEFIGEDNGSPISAKANYLKRKTSLYSTTGNQTASLNKPLEVMVETMDVHPTDLLTQVKIGDQFKRIVRRLYGSQAKQIISKLIQQYPLETYSKPDEASERFIQLMRGKAINGIKLIEDNKLINRDPSFAVLEKAAMELKAWFDNFYQQPSPSVTNNSQKLPPAWQVEHLAHNFAVHAQEDGANITLSAPDYQSGHLDWYSFVKAEVNIPASGEDTQDYIPENISFPGMPHKRLFSFEDHQVDLGTMDINDDDLIRIMMIDFSLYSGSDWYSIPMEMELGEICWINRITVKDVFGVTTPIENGLQETGGYAGPALSIDTDKDGKLTGLDVWDIFKIRDKHITTYEPENHFLYFPPVASIRQESEPLEELLLLRDEFANMVWGIEKRVRNELGKTVDGYDLHLELNGPFIPLDSGDKPNPENYSVYRLSNTVPFNWISYVPKPGSPGYLRRAFMVRNTPESPLLDDIIPLSYLARTELIDLREEAIPKAGVRVQLTRQRLRWTDGKTYIWQGLKVLAGRGEGDSGLRFDYLKEQ